MIIELPLETWTELFGFVPRSQLKKLVPHFGETRKTIGDRTFVSFLQFFLHKFGEVTLGQLRIISSRYGNGPIVIANEANRELPLADVPIPGNVKNFKSIFVRNYSESVIAFLQKFQEDSLLDNVNLSFYACSDFLLEVMTNFLPLCTNINSIQINNTTVLDQLQSEYSKQAIPMLTSARFLFADYNCRDIWFSDWLHIPREDGKPRVLFLWAEPVFPFGFRPHDGPLSHFINHIKKDFLEANQAVSFFIKLLFFRDAVSVQSLTLENGKTQEKLAIKGTTHYATISRYPIGTNDEWIEEMSQHPKTNNRQIEFYKD